MVRVLGTVRDRNGDPPLFPLARDSLSIQPLPILPALFAIRSERHHPVATSLRLLATHLALQVGNACNPYFPISLFSLHYPPPPRLTHFPTSGRQCPYVPYCDVMLATLPTIHSALPSRCRSIHFRSEARSQPHRSDPIRYPMSLRLGLIPPCTSCPPCHRFLTIATPSLPVPFDPF